MATVSTPYVSVQPVSVADTHVVPRRIGAYLIDSILLGICWWIGVAIAAGGGLLHLNVDRTTTITSDGTETKTWYFGSDNNLELFLSYWVVFLAIKAVLEHFYGQTPGKKLLGIRTVSDDGQTAIDWKQAFLRNALLVAPLALIETSRAGAVLLGFVVGIAGCVAMATSDERQRLGDRVASTLVVRKRTSAVHLQQHPAAVAPILVPDVRPGTEEWVHCAHCNSKLQGKNLRWGVWTGRPVPLCPNCGAMIEVDRA
jgi:uncharacterized RDD family membrane protein YckC